MNKRTKIVATLGPSSDDENTIAHLIEAGMDVARLNFSHGTHEEHANQIHILRKLSNRFKKPVTILQDLQGPKLRVGNLPEAGMTLNVENRLYYAIRTSNYLTLNLHTFQRSLLRFQI